jgi:DEAD/DEAH box helicase domain-containing protein
VHSPKCGSGNHPIDKAAALHTVRLLLGHEALPLPAAGPAGDPAGRLAAVPAAPRTAPAPRVVFFDLETQRSAEEVGGWHNAHLMRVALAVVWDASGRRFESFAEKEVPSLLERLAAADLVVGFNVRRFDYAVLRGYTDRDLARLPTFDLLDAVHARLGFRVSLGHLAAQTLGAEKTGDGLDAIRWWQEGRLEELRRYCERDVALLRDLFAFGLEHGFLLFRTRQGERVRVPARWSLAEILETARHAPPAPRPGQVRRSR